MMNRLIHFLIKRTGCFLSTLPIFFLLVGFLIRVVLGVFNRNANDPQIEVIHLLNGRSPDGTWPAYLANCLCGCYHPKLYHFTCAILIKWLGIQSSDHQIVLSQMVNVAVGMVGLTVLVIFINRLECSRFWKIVTSGLICLNPSLVGIDVQVSNDTFVTTFSVLATFYVIEFIKQKQLKSVVFFSIFTLLALLSKGNALMLALWIATVLFAHLVFCVKSDRRNILYAMLIFLLTVVGGLRLSPWPLSTYDKYFEDWTRTGSLAQNYTPAPAPAFWERSYTDFPGVISIVDSFFTFRIVDLILHPFISNGSAPEPFHRTSFWSQLYGRFHFSFFEHHVWWRLDRPAFILGQTLMVVALIPTMVLLLGIVHLFLSIFRRDADFPVDFSAFFQIPLFVSMLVALSYSNRNFYAMKDIYIFPALLSFTLAFIKGAEWLEQKLQRRKIYLVHRVTASLLLGLYFTNLVLMVGDVTKLF